MKICGKVLKQMFSTKTAKNVEEITRNSTTSIFGSTASNTTGVRKAVKVSDAEIEKLMSQGVVPMKYTAKDIVTITARKMFRPIRCIYDAASYLLKRRTSKIPMEVPATRVLEKDLPDCLKGKI